MAEDMGDGRPVGMVVRLSVGRDDEVVALDDVQQFVAGVIHAPVVRYLHEIDLQRILFRIAFHVPQVGFDIVGVAVSQHQDAQPVAAQDEGDAGGIGQFVRFLQIRRLDRPLGEFFQRD